MRDRFEIKKGLIKNKNFFFCSSTYFEIDHIWKISTDWSIWPSSESWAAWWMDLCWKNVILPTITFSVSKSINLKAIFVGFRMYSTQNAQFSRRVKVYDLKISFRNLEYRGFYVWIKIIKWYGDLNFFLCTVHDVHIQDEDDFFKGLPQFSLRLRVGTFILSSIFFFWRLINVFSLIKFSGGKKRYYQKIKDTWVSRTYIPYLTSNNYFNHINLRTKN